MSIDREVFEQVLRELCEDREEYDEIFKDMIRRSEFMVSKYKDQMSYDNCVKRKKLYNKLKFVLRMCDQLDEAE